MKSKSQVTIQQPTVVNTSQKEFKPFKGKGVVLGWMITSITFNSFRSAIWFWYNNTNHWFDKLWHIHSTTILTSSQPGSGCPISFPSKYLALPLVAFKWEAFSAAFADYFSIYMNNSLPYAFEFSSLFATGTKTSSTVLYPSSHFAIVLIADIPYLIASVKFFR